MSNERNNAQDVLWRWWRKERRKRRHLAKKESLCLMLLYKNERERVLFGQKWLCVEKSGLICGTKEDLLLFVLSLTLSDKKEQKIRDRMCEIMITRKHHNDDDEEENYSSLWPFFISLCSSSSSNEDDYFILTHHHTPDSLLLSFYFISCESSQSSSIVNKEVETEE